VVDASSLAPGLWIKRDDLSATPFGGNKVRALEYLLGDVRRGDAVVTVGSAGSTHALAVATYAGQLGARVAVGRWKQEMNDAARVVARRIEEAAERAPVFSSPVFAYAWAWLQHRGGPRHWLPAGGSSPLGTLGHVNAALELAAQVASGALPAPTQVIVPLGSGGTAAGLTLGFRIAGLETVVVGARVVPRIVARHGHVMHLVESTARLIEHHTGERVPRPSSEAFTIAHECYGGAYGRETAAGREAAARFAAWAGLSLDATYSAKACALSLDARLGGPRVFWLTFDPRILSGS
jgi:D-cysteine desulfhydrase